jgi:hypothetical protein
MCLSRPGTMPAPSPEAARVRLAFLGSVWSIQRPGGTCQGRTLPHGSIVQQSAEVRGVPGGWPGYGHQVHG